MILCWNDLRTLLFCLKYSEQLRNRLYQRRWFVLHILLTLCNKAGRVNTGQETRVSIPWTALALASTLPAVICVCTSWIFCSSTRNGHVQRLVLFQNTLKTYAWCIRCQLQSYLNSSAMVAISHPTVIYLWLLSRFAFGASNKEKTTCWVYARIIVEHWTLLSVCWILLLNETFCFPNLVK